MLPLFARRARPLLAGLASLVLFAGALPTCAAAQGLAPVTGQGGLYFLASTASSANPQAGDTATRALYRAAAAGAQPPSAPEVSSTAGAFAAATRQAAGTARLYPAPQGSLLAVVEPIWDSLAPRISIVDTASGRELSFAAALGKLSPQGSFLGWHPDGRRVLYADWDGGTGLWLLDVTGQTAAVRLSEQVPDAAAFSPDGGRLALAWRTSGVNDGVAGVLQARLWLAAGDGSGAQAAAGVAPASAIFGLAWSPGGRSLAYVAGGGEVWTWDAERGEARLLSRNYAPGWDFPAPAWSPDGRTLAFSALASEPAKDEPDAYQEAGAFRHANAHLVDVATGAERPLVPGSSAGNLYPAWSPDGGRLAYLAQTGSEMQIWTARPDGSDPQPATATPGRYSAPAWLPAAAANTPPQAEQPSASSGATSSSQPADQAATAGTMVPAAPEATAPFLSTPYYGKSTITSYFDHKYPTYSGAPNSGYSNVVKYTGDDWPDCGTGASPCIWYNGHDGIDFGMYYQPVLAAAAGRVTVAGWAYPNCETCSYGLYVELDHGNGYRTRYGHMSAVGVVVGQTVSQGQIIGNSGNTGNSTGPHLHFGTHRLVSGYWRPVDPFGWNGSDTDPWQAYYGAVSDWLWAGGEWSGSAVVDPQTPSPITVDDGATGYSQGCRAGSECPSWFLASDSSWVGGAMRWTYLNGSADYWARWSPSLAPGRYEIYAFVNSRNATSHQANFAVRSATGTQATIVAQYNVSNRWVALGEYNLDGSSQVSVSDYTGETDTTRCLGVDAVRFVLRSPAVLPEKAFLPLALRNWPPIPTVPVLNPVAAPESLGSYTLAWSAAERATSYVLQEATAPDFADATEIYAGAETSFTVTSRGLRTYYYRVLARNSWGDSAWSNVQPVDVRWESEANNTLATANGPLASDLDYYGYQNDLNDYFFVEQPVTGTLTIDVANPASGMWVILYGAAQQWLTSDSTAPYHIAYAAKTPGRYTIRVYTTGSYNSSKAYTLRVTRSQ